MAQGTADILDALRALDNSLMEWLLLAAPTTDAQRAEVEDVRALRTRLQEHMNQLQLHRLKLASAGLKDQAARLGAITAQIKATAKTMATIKEVAAAVGDAVSITSTVVGAVAG